ncbi:MAG TPA: hypothetical protein VN328_13700 [Thermodesulfovibrionales bacterium]|nr:hypothetical protein [Thermodesulfovibrionales bacterium]
MRKEQVQMKIQDKNNACHSKEWEWYRAFLKIGEALSIHCFMKSGIL